MTQPTRRRPWWRGRWWTPVVALALGGVMFAAMSAGGDSAAGAKSFAVMAVVAAVFWLGGRSSETIAGLGGPGRDERWAAIDLRATSIAGLVVALAIGGSWLWELARGEDGSPYSQLLAIAGIAYIVAVAVLRRRS